MANWTKQQRKTVEGIPTGLRWNSGVPCECGPGHINTKTSLEYSDTMLYKHRCRECGSQFSTWTEG